MPGASWRRRSGSQHRRLCARPGCGTIAAATLRFQPTQREAWLLDLDVSTTRVDGDLCARHAAALVLPRGWELHDERSTIPSAVTPISLARPRPARPRLTRARTTDQGTAELPGLVTDAPAPPEIQAEPARRVPPQLGVTEATDDDELAQVLDARTPLLKRAFSNTRPRAR
jgi:uncharacterized protein DUF3499